MKPNTRILDYVTLVQDGIMTVDDAPSGFATLPGLKTIQWSRILKVLRQRHNLKRSKMLLLS